MRKHTNRYSAAGIVLDLVCCASLLPAWAGAADDKIKSARRLTTQAASELVLAVPEAVATKKNGGCPEAELTQASGVLAFFQVRNSCPARGSGMIGNYTVNLQTGQIRTDDERRRIIDSPHVREVKRRLTRKRS